MKISLDKNGSDNQIQAYQPGSFKINDQEVTHGVIINEQDYQEWCPDSIDTLEEKDIESALAYEPDILVMGTGSRQIFPPAQLMVSLAQKRIGLEVMDTAAACRTYNVLRSEGRNVTAAILPIEME